MFCHFDKVCYAHRIFSPHISLQNIFPSPNQIGELRLAAPPRTPVPKLWLPIGGCRLGPATGQAELENVASLEKHVRGTLWKCEEPFWKSGEMLSKIYTGF